jgi:2',3'-cyclic-nucleotide 2'-phosphodiesterase/3'-nucleotidase
MLRFLIASLICLCPTLRAERASVTVLATTDLHGNIFPVDYFSNRPAERGLAKIATLIRQARSDSPQALLIDCGDTIQGSPLEYVWQTYAAAGRLPLSLSWSGAPPAVDPMMLVMNHLGYDAMTLGNHEFNYGLKNLNRARSEARFRQDGEPGQGGSGRDHHASHPDLGKGRELHGVSLRGWCNRRAPRRLAIAGPGEG